MLLFLRDMRLLCVRIGLRVFFLPISVFFALERYRSPQAETHTYSPPRQKTAVLFDERFFRTARHNEEGYHFERKVSTHFSCVCKERSIDRWRVGVSRNTVFRGTLVDRPSWFWNRRFRWRKVGRATTVWNDSAVIYFSRYKSIVLDKKVIIS